jgi:type IV secretion system protein VirB2
MRVLSKVKGAVKKTAVVAWGSAFPAVAMAGGSMPWDGPIQNIKTDLQGPVAGAFVTVAIIATGLMWSFGEHGSSMRKVAGIAAGGSMALGGATAVSDLTGNSASSGAVLGGHLYALQNLPAVLALALAAAGMGFYVYASFRYFADRYRARQERAPALESVAHS